MFTIHRVGERVINRYVGYRFYFKYIHKMLGQKTNEKRVAPKDWRDFLKEWDCKRYLLLIICLQFLASMKEKTGMVWTCLCVFTQLSGSDFSCKGVSWVPGKILFSTIIQIELAKYTFNNSILKVAHVPPLPPFFFWKKKNSSFTKAFILTYSVKHDCR